MFFNAKGFNRLEGDSLIQTVAPDRGCLGRRISCFNRLEGDSLIQTTNFAADLCYSLEFQSP